MAPNKIIIDTDPGVDDVLAMLLAFSAKPEELQVLLLSLTHGNIDIQNCLRNVITLFHFIEKEQAWRKQNGRSEGFESLMACKPIVAIGAEEPLADQMMLADFFHGIDGLGGIHTSHPHLTPSETWKSLFSAALKSSNPEEVAAAREAQETQNTHSLFTPSQKPAHEEMLRLLRENEPDTITIVAIGPLTNLAIAAATDPETFLRVKEVVVMGGAVDVPGNVMCPDLSLIYSPQVLSISVPRFGLIKQPDTPLRRMLNVRNQMTPGAEFNTFADSVAAARVFALTSPNPKTTMPTVPDVGKYKGKLGPYPESLSRKLRLKLFPLDITTPHLLPRQLFTSYTAPLSDSPLAQWVTAFLTSTYNKVLSLKPPTADPSTVGLEMHDPLTIWHVLTPTDAGWKFTENEDIRVEASGQWTRGCCIVDKRGKRMRDGDVDLDVEVAGDSGLWMDKRAGNRVLRCVKSPGEEKFAGELMERVFGPSCPSA
ncbi:nucleoside hydrolase [Delitschia confertaspora ATCC 74209]|uniref:Nucleoside hydrolase n=1 Tax=Delitschia confertaspora ATCC 74209 TaxID=1513339 RepID=A0A9P4JT06_9PLEO|nr:nucleoside hydrolase [Delitschia confertaspora ATCC 74209]